MEVVGQAQLIGTPDELVEGFTPGEEWDMNVKIDVWPEAVWTAPWDDGNLEVTVEREAKDQSVRDKAMEALRERYCDVVDAEADYARLAAFREGSRPPRLRRGSSGARSRRPEE